MNRRRVAIVTAMTACVLANHVTSAAAQAPTTPSALINVSATGTRRDGPSGGSAMNARRLGIDESYTFGLFDNNFEGVAVADWPHADWPGQCAWRISVKVLSVQIDSVRFELDWARYDRKSRGPVIGDTRTITLRKGRRHVLDLVQSPLPASRLANIVIEVEASDVVDPPYAGLLIGYDLWLVHENEAGQKITRRVELSGEQGETKHFSFDPIEFELPFRAPGNQDTPQARLNAARAALRQLQLRLTPAHPDVVALQRRVRELEAQAAGQSEGDVQQNVKMLTGGQVSARLQPDGTFEISLTGERTFVCPPGGGAGGGSGSKSFVARPGETVGVVVPNYPVGCTIPVGEATATNLPRGVTLDNGRARIAFDEFFHGDKTSFLVTVRRLK